MNTPTITLQSMQALVIESARPTVEEFGHACERAGDWVSYESECYDFSEVIERLDDELQNAAIDHGKFRAMAEKGLTVMGFHMNPDPDVSLIEAAKYMHDSLPEWMHECEKPLFDWGELFSCLNPNG